MELVSGPVVVRVVPARGGRVSSIRLFDHELLVGPGDPDEDPRRWGLYLMAPWVGRMSGARFAFGGLEHRLVADEGPHALHGLVLDRPWTVVAANVQSVAMRVDLGPLGWPFGGEVGQRIRVWPDRIRFEAWVITEDPAPIALGWHPWFRRGEPLSDAVLLDAEEVLETRPDLVATGRREPVDATTDLRADRPLGTRRLDHSYVGPASPATLRISPLTLTVEFSRRVRAVHVHTPEHGICVEPMTAWPNAANLAAAGIRGSGLARLPAGGRLAAAMTWRWTMDPR